MIVDALRDSWHLDDTAFREGLDEAERVINQFLEGTMQDRERRYKVIRLSSAIAMQLMLNPQMQSDGTISALTVEGIPDDAVVDGVSLDQYADCFRAKIWSASFPVVPDCEELPALHVTIRRDSYRIASEYRGREFL